MSLTCRITDSYRLKGGISLERQLLFNRDVLVYKNRPKSIYEMLKETEKKFPHKEAVVTDDIRLTYQELVEKVDHFAKHLQHQYKLQKGDRVAMLIGNKVEFIYTILACASLGIICVPLNIRSSEDELMYMINHADVQLICADAAFENVVKRWREEDENRPVIFINKPSFADDYELFSDVLEKNYEDLELQKPKVNEEDPLYIIFTSGTTGLPKGAVGSHVNVIHSVLNYKRVLQLDEHTRTLIAVPLFHVTGLIGQMFFMILIGGTSVLMESYKTDLLLKYVEEEKITFLFNVPAIYIMMLNHENFKNTDVSSLQTLAYGGAPMSQETIEALMTELPNLSLHNAYGATETSSPTTIMPKLDDPGAKGDSVGQPVPVAEVKVVNDKGEEVKRGEPGELYIKGPMVIGEYWRNDKANKDSFIDGYWKSGDMALIDEDNFVYILDRKKDMINRGGEKIYSVEVENKLYEHPDILEVAVVGISDEIFGEAVKAFIVPKENAEITLESVQEFLRGKIAKYKIPEHVEIINAMPRNAGGKILKTQLVQAEKEKKASKN